ncbi:sensor histidine kinase [Limnobacter litoralis]|uniref:histidine kinase n=1 Tax=Limnobacter litoralis TaxID=481366 RepID=A0ABQ5YSM3_9BURK|nr:ATP-binding protein [Limnobacter litoralis]GLR26881.1 hypothetical protein GCM10007875_19710 [Limnobacter litoralis]
MLKLFLRLLSILTGRTILPPEKTEALEQSLQRSREQNKALDQRLVDLRQQQQQMLSDLRTRHQQESDKWRNEVSSNQTEMARLREQIAQLAQSTDQETLRQLTENQQLIEQLNWLSGTIAHDFRAPLRAIDAYSFFLDDELGDSAPAEAKSSLGEIRRNGKRLGVLIDGLIDFLRLSTCPLNRVNFDLGDAVRELLNMGFRGAPIHIDKDLHFPMKFDPELAVRMMKELLDNAVKFSAGVEDPKITVRKVSDSELEITDNGVGFSSEHSDKLFRLFHRMHGNDEFAGEGIGLCIAQRIAGRHGLTLGLHRVGNLTVASLSVTQP